MVPPEPRVLFGENPKYRLVVKSDRAVLEYEDTDAAGGIRWNWVQSWPLGYKDHKEHAGIALSCLLRQLNLTIEQPPDPS